MLTDDELDGMADTILAALPDTGTIERPTAGGSLDDETGVWTPAATTTIYTGVMRLRSPSVQESEVLFGDREVTRQRFTITLPATVDQIEVGDRVTVTTSSDPHIDARRFAVVAVASGSFHVDRRIGVEVIE